MPTNSGQERTSTTSQVRGRTSSSTEAASTAGASPFKRQKLDSKVPQTPPSANKAPSGLVAMYSFSPTKNGVVIDLTQSSPEAPRGNTPVKGNGLIKPANSNPSNKPKKFAVKNLKTAVSVDHQAYFDRVWKQLEGAFETILARNERPTSLEELYRSVEYLCRQGKAPELFQNLHYRCREHVCGPLRGQIQTVARAANAVETLGATVRAWNTWKIQMAMLKSVFLYLNQSYLISHNKDPTLDDLAVQLFRNHIFKDPALQPLILSGACQLVSVDRDNSTQFKSTQFSAAIQTFHDLAVYTKSFEPRLLALSQAYFSDWAAQNSGTLTLADYCMASWNLLSKENERCATFDLDASTRRNMNEQMHTYLVDQQLEFLTDTNRVGELMREDQFKCLGDLFKLLHLKSHGAKLRPACEAYVEADGESIIFDEKREQEMVPRLLAFKRKNDKILNECFDRQTDLGIGIREAFRKFINKTKKSNMTWGTDNEKAGEMIAKYVDVLLRGGLKAIHDEDDAHDEGVDGDEKMNQQLDQVLELFRFLNGKAVFEAFYKKDLAKRLLLKQSANDRAEKSMLERLKNECGANFTSNLEQMFKDIDLSRDENAAYKTRRQDREEKGGPDLEVNVLESSAWPSYPDVPIEIPQSIQDATRKFEEHYQSHHSGRKLSWKHDRAYCQLTARYDKSYVIVVSAFQAVVLLYFNAKKDEAVTYPELREATKLNDANLIRTLQSLACAKFKVLKKSTKGPEVKESDTFIVNKDFKTDKVRFRINQIQLKETKEENKATHERVAADREFETQAAIVRIMKSEQKIKHQNLVVKVIEALKKRGSVQPEDIKKQIDKLIDKDYMERIENNMYEYVA